MNRKDISSLNNLFTLVTEAKSSSTSSGPPDLSKMSQDELQEYLYEEGQRLNKESVRGLIVDVDWGTPITRSSFSRESDGQHLLTFYTYKANPNDYSTNAVLHNDSGPAVIFEEGGKGNEFYFIKGQKVEEGSDEFRAIQADAESKKRRGVTGNEPKDDDEGDMSLFG